MTDKMPTNFYAFNPDEVQYTLVHNNPEYHVIPKSDVDGDVLGALEKIEMVSIQKTSNEWEYEGDTIYAYDTIIEQSRLAYPILRNALIAQSDPDMVRIPRKVLEGAIKPNDYIPTTKREKDLANYGYNKAINDVLNYKEGE